MNDPDEGLPKLSDLLGLCEDSPIDIGGSWSVGWGIEKGPMPCPFCGGIPKQSNHYSDTGGGDGRRCYVIKCMNPKCGIKPCSVASGPRHYDTPQEWDNATNEEAQVSVLRKWNTRAN